MTYDEFMQALHADGRYETPAERASNKRLPRPLATLKFHALNLGNVIRNCTAVKRGKWSHDTWTAASFATIRHCESVGATVVVEGFHNLVDVTGPVVYAGNHMSLLETFMLTCLTQPVGEASFVVKESLLKYPLFGPILRSGQPISVTRRDPRQDLATVLRQGRDLLESGRSIIIFPQATRSLEFSSQAFNSLGARLAVRSGVPLVPVAVKTDFLRPGRLVRDFGAVDPSRPIGIAFGTAVRAADAKDLHAACVESISKWMHRWGVPCT